MKKRLQISLVFAIVLFASIGSASAQITTFEDFKNAFEVAKVTPGGGNIVIGSGIIVTEEYVCSSSAENPVTIGTVEEPTTSLITIGSGGKLTLGDNVFVYATIGNLFTVVDGELIVQEGCVIASTATCPILANGEGLVTINGGEISSSNYPAVQANSANALVIINGGEIYTTNAGTSFARGLIVQNGSKCIVNGGTISADLTTSGRAIGLVAGTVTVNGGTIRAAGTSGRAIQGDDNGALLFVNGGTISAENATGAAGAVVLQKGSRAVITGGTFECAEDKALVINNAPSAKIWDFRAIEISASPGEGSYSTSQNVVLSTSFSASQVFNQSGDVLTNLAEGAEIRYTLDGSSVLNESDSYISPVNVSIPSVLNVAAEKDGFLGQQVSFEYTSISTSINSVKESKFVVNTLVKERIDLSNVVGLISTEIFNINGQSLSVHFNEKIINASSLPSGIYLLKVQSAEETSFIKIVKQ